MCNRCNGPSDAFVKGMATILWGSAWSGHAEEHDCCQKIEDHMPEIPEVAWRKAERLAGAIEQANGMGLAALFSQAMRADGHADLVHEDYWSDQAERFGACLAYMAMGSGVSWFDDHEEFKVNHGGGEPKKLGVPNHEDAEFELRLHADDSCKRESRSGRIQCHECSSYGKPEEECNNCGNPVLADRAVN